MRSEHLWAIALSGSADINTEHDSAHQRTLLGNLEAARRVADPGRILAVTLEQNRPWWEPELRDLPMGHVGAQPFDRGSGVALLFGALALYRKDPQAEVAVFTRGQHPAGLLRDARNQIARLDPGQDVTLFASTSEDREQGGTLVIPRLGSSDQGPSLVSSLITAERGRVAGRALVSSGILFGRAEALIDLYEAAQPLLTRRMMREFYDQDPFSREAAHGIYPFLTSVDLFSDVLSAAPDRLLVAKLGAKSTHNPATASLQPVSVARA